MLNDLVRSFVPPFAFAGVAVSKAGEGSSIGHRFAIAGAPEYGPDTMMRVASLSKIVTGQLFAGVDLSQPVTPLLGFDLTHPAGGEITLAHLLSHTAGLDDGPLPVRLDQDLDQWIAENPIWLDHAPGTYFAYSNLGYVLLAACSEMLFGAPFADLTARWLRDHDVPGGFNWVGVGPDDVRQAMPIFRRDGGQHVPQVDATPMARGLGGPDGFTGPMGRNIAMMSPQGGLRTSLRGMLALARSLPALDARILWDAAQTPGDTIGGIFAQYSLGLQFFDKPSFYPHALCGHFGNAYGFKGGAWYDLERGLPFAYALNGLDMGDESDSFHTAELEIFAAVAAL